MTDQTTDDMRHALESHSPISALRSGDRPQRNKSPQSSKDLLRMSIEHAHEAVKLDSNNENPEAAVAAYAQSAVLLSEVMERIRKGEYYSANRMHRPGSAATQEDKLRRLQNIYDTYLDRMNILCIVYNLQKPNISYPTETFHYSLSRTSSAESVSLYSVASSRTAETDYGLFYTRRALSQTSLDYYPSTTK